MTANEAPSDHHHARRFTIEVADETLAFRKVGVVYASPTGNQIAEAAGFSAERQATVFHFLPDGEMDDVHPAETVDVTEGGCRFVVAVTDRIYFMTINGDRFEWPGRLISGAVVRRLGKIGSDDRLFLALPDSAEREIDACDLVDLDKPGIEAFVSRRKSWKLNVQGIILTFHQPTVIVREAIEDAGINPDSGWQIFLLVQGRPKESVSLDHTIDLRTPGIEKLRLTPSGVNNGEAAVPPKRNFALLETDETYLDALGYRWETDAENSGRWLLIHNYRVPTGYTVASVTLALLVPPNYPAAMIDMFYTYPALKLASGHAIPATQQAANIRGLGFNGWSRHRPWNPAVDNVVTQIAMVDSAIAKEVGE